MTNQYQEAMRRPSTASSAYSAQSSSNRSETWHDPVDAARIISVPSQASLQRQHRAHPPRRQVVRAGHGYAFEVKKGEHFRVVDLYGKQVVDFAAWASPDMREKLSMSYSRMRLKGTTPAKGEVLRSNRDDPMFRIMEDTVKVHDMTWPSCFPELYDKMGLRGHRSCATNIVEVMRPYGITSYLEINDPFNMFQNTPNYALKDLNPSRAGDYIQLEALKDAVCTVSCCPYDQV